MTTTTALVSFQDMQQMAESFARSGFFGIKTPDQAVALMALCQAEGMHPATALRDYHLIQGKPALKADAMLARFLSSGGKVQWTAYTDERVAAVFSHPQGGSVEVDWTPARAKQARISNDMHQKYPRQMLRARVISEGIRTVYPGVVIGVYTPEEVQDMQPSHPLQGYTVDPRGEVEPMDPELREQYATALDNLLAVRLKDLPPHEAAKTCIKVHEIWGELDNDQQIQVMDSLKGKGHKTKLKEILKQNVAEVRAKAEAIDGEVVTTTETQQ